MADRPPPCGGDLQHGWRVAATKERLLHLLPARLITIMAAAAGKEAGLTVPFGFDLYGRQAFT
jgi:hypothetical protein